jgi:hypothetical protein
VQKSLLELAPLLRAGNMRALSVFEQLVADHGSEFTGPALEQLQAIGTAINAFDFSNAFEACQRMLALVQPLEPTKLQ